MKKNLMTMVILALVLVNLVLTALLMFTILPQTQKSNALIDEIAAAISLDLQSGDNAATTIPIEDIEVYDIADSFTVNLKNDGSNYTSYAVFTVGFSLNTQSEGYKTYGGSDGLAEKETIIRNDINTIVSGFTLDEFNENSQAAVKEAILEEMQSLFGGTDFIVAVSFSSVNTESVKSN